MLKNKVLNLIKINENAIKNYNVQSLYLFGSVARGEERPDSDIDILVAFVGTPSFDQYMDLKFFLEDLFNRKVDLVTISGLREEIRSYIEKDLIRAA